jgi:hypothetical protein
VLLREIDKLLPRAKTCYRATAELWLRLYELRKIAVARFERERDNAKEDTKANKALQRVRKRWEAIANGASLKDGRRRELGTLKILHDKVIKARWAIDGAASGYWEAAAGGDRLLSDEVWQGRLTAQELRLRLEATDGACVAGDREAKEIRRVLRKLGIRLAEDQRGRKWKSPYLKNQEPKRPRGRPRTRSDVWSDTVCVRDLEKVESMLEARRRGRPLGDAADEPALKDVFIDPDLLKVGRKDDDSATKLFTQYGEQRFKPGTFIDKHEARRSRRENKTKCLPPNPLDWRKSLNWHDQEEQTPERSPVFAAWMGSIAELRYPQWMEFITKLAYPVWMTGSLTEILTDCWWRPWWV